MKSEIQSSIDSFEKKLNIGYNKLGKKYAKKTIHNYVTHVSRYLKWYKKVPLKKDNKKIKLKAYIKILKKTHSSLSVNLHLAAIDVYYAKQLGITEKFIRTPVTKTPIKIYTENQVDTLLRACRGDRDKIIILFAYDCALHLHEIEKLQYKNINFKTNCVIVNKRSVPMSSTLINMLYLCSCDKKPSDYLFIKSTSKNPIAKRTIQKMFVLLCKKAKIPNLGGLRNLRYTKATYMIAKGKSLNEIGEFLGLVNKHRLYECRKLAKNIKIKESKHKPLNTFSIINSKEICDYCEGLLCKTCKFYNKFDGKILTTKTIAYQGDY